MSRHRRARAVYRQDVRPSIPTRREQHEAPTGVRGRASTSPSAGSNAEPRSTGETVTAVRRSSPRPSVERADRLGHHIARLPRPDDASVQRYALAREPSSKQLYSVSDGKDLVTGMSTPNHELYVGNPTKIGQMNNVAASSPLEFFSEGRKSLFSRNYFKVGLRFQTAHLRGRETQDTQALYENAVAPQARRFREGLLGGRLVEIEAAQKRSQGDLDPKKVNRALKQVTASLELFKKVVLSTLASMPEAPTSAIKSAQFIVQAAEAGIFSKAASKDPFGLMVQQVSEFVRGQTKVLQQFPIVRDTVNELCNGLEALWSVLPAKSTVDLMSFHGANFQFDQMEMLEKDSNLLLYRACDVMASTMLGNKVTARNQQNLMAYASQHNSRAIFHYATKLATDGDDWVSIESFAASDRDREIIGVRDEDSYKNIDNTWQYIMYGSLAGPEKDLSDQDRSFAFYTQLRYFLKGAEKPGGFNTNPREKLIPKPLASTHFERLFTGSSKMFTSLANRLNLGPARDAATLFDHLKTVGLLGGDGRVADPEGLTEERVIKALDVQYTAKASAIFRVLKASIPPPHIQVMLNSDQANQLAWRSLLGDTPMNLVESEMEMSNAIMELGEDPAALSRRLWNATFDMAEKAPKQRRQQGPLLLTGPRHSPGKSSETGTTTSSETSRPERRKQPTSSQPTSSQPTSSQPTSSSVSAPQPVDITQAQSRQTLIQLGTAELNRLRALWRSATGSTGNPIHYLDRLAAIESITQAPPYISLGHLKRDVALWLQQARGNWNL
ncbi:MAG: hypothetical protein AAGE94_04005 [Acidobacteriota bacterium]